MEAMFGRQESLQTADSVALRLVADAKRSYEGELDDDVLEQCARDAVREIWHDSVTVTTFVPVLAMRRMQEIVSSREVSVAGASSEP